MDPTQFTHVSLCAGYGGIDLGLRRVLPGLRTVAYSEIEEYACALLAARMESGHLDPAPIWSDLKTFPFREFHGCVDILSGGYPCQPFSAAGKRRGTDDPRHLWPYIADGIRLCQPSICFFENVEGHITLGLRDVLGDLERLGYQATWGIFSASEVGAPHQRKRVFILAHRKRSRLEGLFSEPRQSADAEFGQRCPSVWPSRPGEQQHAWEPPRVVANAHRRGLEGAGAKRGRAEDAVGSDRESSDENLGDAEDRNGEGQRLQLRQGEGEHRGASGCERDGRRETKPSLGRNSDGPAGGMDYAELCISCDSRVDELRLLGNGVVPATAALAFRTLLTQLDYDLQRMHPAAPDRTQFDPGGRGGPPFRLPADDPALGRRPAAGTAHPNAGGCPGQA